jgi:1-deoxy-D-xylulose-5-phosphate synthase
VGQGVVRRTGNQLAILNFGTTLAAALEAAEQLNATVADMRFVKPIDQQLIRELAAEHQLLVTVEENSVAGGAGAAVSEFLAEEGIVMPVLHIGLPDRFVDHASHSEQLQDVGLDSAGILRRIEQRLDILQLPTKAAQ